MRNLICIILLVLQCASIIISRFIPFGYFNWTPYDAINLFTLEVSVNGTALSADEIYQRYRIKKDGRNNRNIQHVKNALKQYEETYGRDDRAKIKMVYQTNSLERRFWQWPQ